MVEDIFQNKVQQNLSPQSKEGIYFHASFRNSIYKKSVVYDSEYDKVMLQLARNTVIVFDGSESKLKIIFIRT